MAQQETDLETRNTKTNPSILLEVGHSLSSNSDLLGGTPTGFEFSGSPKEPLQSDFDLPAPPKKPLQGDFDLPAPPEEPLQSDCCGTGCTPCVLDVYQEELEKWLRLKAMSPQERAEWRRLQQMKHKETVMKTALSLSQYKLFTISEVEKLTTNTFLFTFSLPPSYTLGLQVGQHVLLR